MNIERVTDSEGNEIRVNSITMGEGGEGPARVVALYGTPNEVDLVELPDSPRPGLETKSVPGDKLTVIGKMVDPKLDELLSVLRPEIDALKEQLDTWRERFEKDPKNAFEWSVDTFKVAAKYDLYRRMVAYITEGVTPEAIRDYLDADILNNGRHVESSSSPTSNLIERCALAATIEFLGYVNRYV